MYVRRFRLADADYLIAALGSCGFAFGPATVAVLHRPVSLVGAGDNFLIEAGTAWNAGWAIHTQNGKLMYRSVGSSVWGTDATGVAVNNWYIHGVSKASGSIKPRMHRCLLSTGAWAHEDASGVKSSSPVPTTRVEFGYHNWTAESVGSGYDGYMVLAALWNRELADAEFETIDSLAALVASAPVALWDFTDGDTATGVQDTIGAADEASRSGTWAISSIEVPNFDFGVTDPDFRYLRYPGPLILPGTDLYPEGSRSPDGAPPAADPRRRVHFAGDSAKRVHLRRS